MKTFENIERMFNDEVRHKKRTGRGAFSMRGKGVKHGISGALKTPYHFMSAKERKKLNGKVEVYSMYETIIPKEEFDLKDKETQKKMLTRWREIYPTKKIKQELGIANAQFYTLVDRLQVPKLQRGGAKNKEKKENAEKLITNSGEKKEDKPAIQEQQPVEQEQIQKLITKGLHLEYNGCYNCDDLNKLFTKLQLILEGETNKYNIYLTLTEKQND